MPLRSYEIRVRGQLGGNLRAAFPGLRARTRGDDTVLSGALADRAALYGLLAMIETLGLELVELRQVISPDLVSRTSPRRLVNWKSLVKTRPSSTPISTGRNSASMAPAAWRPTTPG